MHSISIKKLGVVKMSCQRFLRIISTTLLLLSCVGCGTAIFAPPQSQPVISSNISSKEGKLELIALATTSERREIVFRSIDGHFCAEPPPDTADAVSAQFSNAIQASASKGASDPSISASLGVSSSNAIASLAKRSQGVILYRDVSFNLCEALLNGAMSPQEYSENLKQLFSLVVPLIQSEINVTSGKIGPDAAIVNSVSAANITTSSGTPKNDSGTPTTENSKTPSSTSAPASGNSAQSKATSAGDAANSAAVASVTAQGGSASDANAAGSAAKTAAIDAVNKGANPIDAATQAAVAAAAVKLPKSKSVAAKSTAEAAVGQILGGTFKSQDEILKEIPRQINSNLN